MVDAWLDGALSLMTAAQEIDWRLHAVAMVVFVAWSERADARRR